MPCPTCRSSTATASSCRRGPGFVTVAGAVVNSNAFVWKPGRTAGDYLRLAGPDEAADTVEHVHPARRRHRHAAPATSAASSAAAASSRRCMQPGDALIVPNQLDFETWGRALVRNLKDFAQIFSGFGIGIAAIQLAQQLSACMKSADLDHAASGSAGALRERRGRRGSGVGLADLLTWLGERQAADRGGDARRRRSLALVCASADAAGLHRARDVACARLAAAEQLGGGARRARLARRPRPAAWRRRSPDELYVALLKSDSVQRALTIAST